MAISRTQRVLAALGCLFVCVVFAGATWINDLTGLAWLLVFLGIGVGLVFLFAPKSVLKTPGALW